MQIYCSRDVNVVDEIRSLLSWLHGFLRYRGTKNRTRINQNPPGRGDFVWYFWRPGTLFWRGSVKYWAYTILQGTI
jgi:hypothetical protein